MILWKWEICHSNLAQSTPELRVMDLLSQMDLGGHWGLVFFFSPCSGKKPQQPQVCYSLSILCSFVCVCVQLGLWGLLAGVGDTCYCCSTGICHRNGMSCQTERPFPAVGPQQRDAAGAPSTPSSAPHPHPGTTTVT